MVPAALSVRVVHPYFRRTVQNRNHGIDPAIVVKVAESRTAMRSRDRKRCSRLRTYILKYHAAFVAKHAVGKRKRPVRQLHGIIQNVCVGGEQVFVSVIIKSEKLLSPRRRATGQGTQPCRRRDISKFSVPLILVQWKRFPEHCCLKDVRLSIIVYVAKICPHASRSE